MVLLVLADSCSGCTARTPVVILPCYWPQCDGPLNGAGRRMLERWRLARQSAQRQQPLWSGAWQPWRPLWQPAGRPEKHPLPLLLPGALALSSGKCTLVAVDAQASACFYSYLHQGPVPGASLAWMCATLLCWGLASMR